MTASARTVRCLVLLRRGWRTKRRLGDELGVSLSSVKRYLRAIEAANVRLEVHGTRRGGDPLNPEQYRVRAL